MRQDRHMDCANPRALWTVTGADLLCSTHGNRAYLAVVSANSQHSAIRLFREAFPAVTDEKPVALPGIREPGHGGGWLIPHFMRPQLLELNRPEARHYLVDDAVLFTWTFSVTLWGHVLMREVERDVRMRTERSTE